MKRKIFNKMTLLLVSLLIFGVQYRCIQDEPLPVPNIESTNNRGFIVNKVYRDAIVSNTALSSQLTRFREISQTSTTGRVVYDEATGIAIETDYAKYIENENGGHSYTFHVVNNQDGGLKNVVLSSQDDGTYKETLVYYNITEQEIADLKEGIYGDLDNKITFSPLATNTFANQMARIVMVDGCRYHVTTIHHSCNNGGNHHYPEPCDPGTNPDDAAQPDTYIYTLLSCGGGDGGGGDGSDGAGGGGDGSDDNQDNSTESPSNNADDHGPQLDTTPVFEMEEEENIHCEELSRLSSNDSYIERMNELKTATAGNKEISYRGIGAFGHADDFPNSTRAEGNPNEHTLKFDISLGTINSVIHNHFGATSLPIFSPFDIFAIYKLYLDGRIQDLTTFTMVVITPNSLYCIKIEDVQQFADMAVIYGITHQNMKDLYDEEKINVAISPVFNEAKLVSLLNNQNTGLRLFRGDRDDFSKWTELVKVKVGGSVKTKTCN
jgi:hypothetical protein